MAEAEGNGNRLRLSVNDFLATGPAGQKSEIISAEFRAQRILRMKDLPLPPLAQSLLPSAQFSFARHHKSLTWLRRRNHNAGGVNAACPFPDYEKWRAGKQGLEFLKRGTLTDRQIWY
jgi:hypothetical protein